MNYKEKYKNATISIIIVSNYYNYRKNFRYTVIR